MKTVAFQVQPSEPARVIVTLANGRQVEVALRVAVIEAHDHEQVNAVGVPEIDFDLQVLLNVRALDTGASVASGVPVTAGKKAVN